MPQGNWKCSGCGGAITELPFEPRSTEGLLCRDCFRKKSNPGSGVVAPTETGGSAPEPMDAPPEDAGLAGEAPDIPPEAYGEVTTVAQPGERQMFEGSWQCSHCGNEITKLPFKPRGDASNLKCIDCFKNSKG